MYKSKVSGRIIPAQGLDVLVTFLVAQGYVLEDWQRDGVVGQAIVGPDGHNTGLFAYDKAGDIEGKEVREESFAFDSKLLEMLQAATDAGLIEGGALFREGDSGGDEEEYKLDNGIWCRWVSAGAWVPSPIADRVQTSIAAAVGFVVAGNAAVTPKPFIHHMTPDDVRANVVDGLIEAFVKVSLDQIVTDDAGRFLQRLSELVSGTNDLVDIEYQVVGQKDDNILFHVRANPCFLLHGRRVSELDVARPSIVVPALDAPPLVCDLFRRPVPGSVCVAVPGPGGQSVLVYYEGGIHVRKDRRPTDEERDDYARNAAGRAVNHDSTTAFFQLPSADGLVVVGTVNSTTMPYSVEWDEDGLRLWRDQHVMGPWYRVGYTFHVSGEYCEDLQGLDGPSDEDWQVFQMAELHPAGESHIVIWTQYARPCAAAEQEAIDKAITVIEWMCSARGWKGLDAELWEGLPGAGTTKRVFRWELV